MEKKQYKRTILATCITCKKERKVLTNGTAQKTYEHLYPRCKSCAGKLKILNNPSIGFSKGHITWIQGKKHSEVSNQKNRIAHLGKKHSIETRQKMSMAQKNIGNTPPHPKGKDHWNWRGGITPLHRTIRVSKEYKLWRKAVFERDNYTCIWCGQKGVVLNADHIKAFADYPELRFAIDNGRTLCTPCHKTTETYGMKGRHHKSFYKKL